MMVQTNFNRKIMTKNRSANAEIFFFVCSALIDTGLTSKVNYLVLKRRFFYLAILSTNTKSINVKLKMSRFDVKKGNNSGTLTGFYRALW